MLLLEDVPSALMDIEAGIQQAATNGLGYMRAFMYAIEAEAHMRKGDRVSALVSVRNGFAHVGEIPGRAWESELHRIHGVLVSAQPETYTDALISLDRALGVAQSQGARSLELRAQSAYLSVMIASRDPNWQNAKRRLEEILGWFSEGFATSDLRNARALLDRSS